MKIDPNFYRGFLFLAVSEAICLGFPVAVNAQIEEIIVTATKREENIQKVAISVTAFTAESLQDKGITDIAKMSNYSPNTTLDASTPFSGSDSVLSAFIRGIGQNDFAINTDPGVGVYVDGVFLARSVGSNTNMLDVERVEVLKGPQGTLFGRNTIGGAISIVTRDPGDELWGKAEITGGSENRIDFRGTMDVPLGEQLRSSISFSRLSRDGYQDRVPYPGEFAGSSGIPDCDALAAGTPCPTVVDGFDNSPAAGYKTSSDEGGQDQWSMRGKLVFDASDRLSLKLTGDYTDIDQSATPATVVGVNANLFGLFRNLCHLGVSVGGPYCGTRLGLTPVPSPFPSLPSILGVNVDGDPSNNRIPFDSRWVNSDIDKSYATGNSFSKLKNWGMSGTIDFDINESMHLKSITAYRDMDWVTGMDLDNSPLDILHASFAMKQWQVSQEFQLSGVVFNDRVDYVVGAYYFFEKGDLHDFVTFPDSLLMIDGPNDLTSEATALYANLQIDFTDNITIIAGGRFNVEHKTFEGFQNDSNGFTYKISGCVDPAGDAAALGVPAGLLTCQQALGFPSATEPYRFFPPGTRTQNHKAFTPTIGLQYRPTDDKMFYVTISQGYKTGSWTTRLSAAVPVYDDSLFFDPETSINKEVGMKSDWLDDHLRVNLAVFHTTYDDIQLNSQQGISPTTLNAGDATMYGFELESQAEFGHGFFATLGLGYIKAQYDRLNNVSSNGVVITTDFDLPKTPEWKVHIGPQYNYVPESFGGEFQFNLDYTRTAGMSNDLDNTQLLKRRATDMLNVTLVYTLPNEKYSLVVGGTNLTDERYLVTGQNQGGTGQIYGTYNEPRQWFASLRAEY